MMMIRNLQAGKSRAPQGRRLSRRRPGSCSLPVRARVHKPGRAELPACGAGPTGPPASSSAPTGRARSRGARARPWPVGCLVPGPPLIPLARSSLGCSRAAADHRPRQQVLLAEKSRGCSSCSCPPPSPTRPPSQEQPQLQQSLQLSTALANTTTRPRAAAAAAVAAAVHHPRHRGARARPWPVGCLVPGPPLPLGTGLLRVL